MPADKTKEKTVKELSALIKSGQAQAETMQAQARENMSLSAEEAHRPVSSRVIASATMAFEPSYGEMGKSEAAAAEGVVEAISQPAPEARAMPRAASTAETALDAYWGTYATPEERRAASEMAPMMPEVVIGTDERIEVTNNEHYPWRCICSLNIRAQDGSNFIGTGWLVSPRVVLTAGHCVFLHGAGGWASSIEVIPGRRGSSQPFGSASTGALRSVRGWTEGQNSDMDYGAILLPEDARFGDRLGWFGYTNRSDSELESGVVNLSGYPGDKPSGTQWFQSMAISSHTEFKITYMIDTFGGQSGAPVWQYLPDGGRYGVGIHTSGHLSGNSATRITASVFNNIVSWIGQAP